ncbi:hypothetical protein TNCV_1807311 [Trichonephila clavipes]|nr:hypothetical protein TNCV_1807311 [Trichonephila clavipes]
MVLDNMVQTNVSNITMVNNKLHLHTLKEAILLLLLKCGVGSFAAPATSTYGAGTPPTGASSALPVGGLPTQGPLGHSMPPPPRGYGGPMSPGEPGPISAGPGGDSYGGLPMGCYGGGRGGFSGSS